MADEEQSEKKKLFGKYHELLLLVIGSALAVLGGFAASEINYIERQHEYQIQRADKRQEDARLFMDETSRMLTKRLGSMTLVFELRKKGVNLDTINDELRKIVAVQEDIYKESSRIIAMTAMYFGKDKSVVVADSLKDAGVLAGEIASIDMGDTQKVERVNQELNKLTTEIVTYIHTSYVSTYSRENKTAK